MLLFHDFQKRFADLSPNGGYQWQPITQALLVSLMSIGCLLGALSGA